MVKRPTKPTVRKHPIIKFALCFIGLCTTMAGLALFQTHPSVPPRKATAQIIQPSSQRAPHAQKAPVKPLSGRETFLLIGSDERPRSTCGNSDVLCVVSLDHEHHRIAMLSIPRDTQVAFPDGKYRKINDSLAIGGPSLTCQVVESLIGISIDHYAIAAFDGLVQIVDRLGGLDLDVPRNMYYRTGDKRHGLIRLHKGHQHLNGEQALGFVRFRHDTLGDIGRTERQQAFLVALKGRLLRPESLPKLPSIAIDLARNVDTDASPLYIGKLIASSYRLKTYETIHGTLPGSFHDPEAGNPGDLSYWIVNPKEARYVSKRFFVDGMSPGNPIQDPSVTKTWTIPKANVSSKP